MFIQGFGEVIKGFILWMGLEDRGFVTEVMFDLDEDLMEGFMYEFFGIIVIGEVDGESEPGLALLERAELVGEDGGEHGAFSVGEVDGGHAIRHRLP
jgi:hypothetical protein